MLKFIEWSPDHWWVTSKPISGDSQISWLNGHQIIGELRHMFYE